MSSPEKDSLAAAFEDAMAEASYISDKAVLGKTVNGYRIISRVGAGGMGTVFMAEHIGMKRIVAIKFLNPDRAAAQDGLRRFEREAKLAGRLNHPNIVQVFDFSNWQEREDAPQRFYLAMEYVEGITLARLLEERTRLPVGEAVAIMVQALEALQAVHAAGIIHRDLKPGNIMLVRAGDGWKVKLTDFGVGKDVHEAEVPVDGESPTIASPLTAPFQIVGTPEYMPLEQLRNLPIDARADLYAMGVILYQMLTGYAPYKCRRDVVSFVMMLKTITPQQLERTTLVPYDIRQEVLKALKQKREERYATASEMRAAILDAARLHARHAAKGRFGLMQALAAIGVLGGLVYGANLYLNDTPAVLTAPVAATAPVTVPSPVPEPKAELPVRLPEPPAPIAPSGSLSEARTLVEQNRFAEASVMLKGLSEKHPSDHKIWFELGQCLSALDRKAEAKEALQRYLRIAPKSDAINRRMVQAKLARLGK